MPTPKLPASDERVTGNLAHQQYRLFHDIYVFLDAGDTTALAGFNLSPSQFRLLFLLDADQGQNLIRLAERMLVARSTITRLIDQMELKGLVKRLSDPDDRRAQRVALTIEGSALRDQAFAAHEASLLLRFSALTDVEQVEFRRLMAKLLTGLMEDGASGDTLAAD